MPDKNINRRPHTIRGRQQGPGPRRVESSYPTPAPDEVPAEGASGEQDESVPAHPKDKIGRRGSVMCPHCSAMVQAVRLERHIQRRHSETLPPAPLPEAPPPVRQKASPFVTCPTCGKTMHRRFLAEHRKQHEPTGIPPK